MAKKLVKKKRGQNCKENDFYDKDLQRARQKIKMQSKISHQSNDPEEARLLKNLKNQYTKMETRKKKEYENKVLGYLQEKWKFMKEDDGCKTSVNIKIYSKNTTCQRKIENEYANHISKKIQKLTDNLPEKKTRAIDIFKKLL